MQNTNTDLLSNALTLSFKNAALEGEYLAEVAKRRWPVLLFIFCFDVLCYFFRITAKCVQLMLEAEPAGVLRRGCDLAREFGPQLANMAVLYLFLGLLNRRSRRLGDNAARQEEVLLSMCMAFAICNLLASLTSENHQDYVYVAFFLICTSTFLKIRWWVGTAIQAVPTGLMQYLVWLGTSSRGLFNPGISAGTGRGYATGLGGGATTQVPAGMFGSAEAGYGGDGFGGKPSDAARDAAAGLTALLPPHAAVHVAVAWAVGGLMAYLADWYRRQMFAHSKMAALAHGSELMEAQARIAAQRALAAAQAQAAQRALSVAREKAANEAKSEFMSLMCHEVRTPLNGCLASAEMLLETPLLAEQRELAATIRVSGSILLSTVSNFLDFFKLEAGKALDIVRTCTDLRQLVADVHCIIEAMLGRGGEVVLLEPDMQGLLSYMVYCDADRVRGILLNLYTNAAKFTKHGHIQLRVREVPPGYAPEPSPDYSAIVVSPPSYNHKNGAQQCTNGHVAYPAPHAGARTGRLAQQALKGASGAASGHASLPAPAPMSTLSTQLALVPSLPGPEAGAAPRSAFVGGMPGADCVPLHQTAATQPAGLALKGAVAQRCSSSPFQQHQHGQQGWPACRGGDSCSCAARGHGQQDQAQQQQAGGSPACWRDGTVMPSEGGVKEGPGPSGEGVAGSAGDVDEVYYSVEASLVSPVRFPVGDCGTTTDLRLLSASAQRIGEGCAEKPLEPPQLPTGAASSSQLPALPDLPAAGRRTDNQADHATHTTCANAASSVNYHERDGILQSSVASAARMQSAVAESSPRWLLFEVADTGTGITPDGLKTLFREYVQGTEDEMRKPRSKGGTGLGLSICSKQVGLLGGRIGAYSCPGRGSIFWFTIPLIEVSSRSHGAEVQEQQQPMLTQQALRIGPDFSPYSEFSSTAPAWLSSQYGANLSQPEPKQHHVLSEAATSNESRGPQSGVRISAGETKPSARLMPFLDGALLGATPTAVWPHAPIAQQQHQLEGMLVGESGGDGDVNRVIAYRAPPALASAALAVKPCSAHSSCAAAGSTCVSRRTTDGMDQQSDPAGAPALTGLAANTSQSPCFLNLLELSASYCRPTLGRCTPGPDAAHKNGVSAACKLAPAGDVSCCDGDEKYSGSAGLRRIDGTPDTQLRDGNTSTGQPHGTFGCADARQPATDMTSAAAASLSALSSMDGLSSSRNRGLAPMFVASHQELRDGSTSYGSVESADYRSHFFQSRRPNVAANADKESALDVVSAAGGSTGGSTDVYRPVSSSGRRAPQPWGPAGVGLEPAGNSITFDASLGTADVAGAADAQFSPNGAALNDIHLSQRQLGSIGRYGQLLQNGSAADGQSPAVPAGARCGGVAGARPGGTGRDFRALVGRRVLLVEDNLINQTVARKMLASLGLQCEVASNGLEAVKRMECAMATAAASTTPRSSNPGCDDGAPPSYVGGSNRDCPTAALPAACQALGPAQTNSQLKPVAPVERSAGTSAPPSKSNLLFDVVLMDMAMPVMGGVDATRAIRRLGCDVPIVAMTANALERDREECRLAGMNGFLSKPVLKEMLAESLLRVLQGSGWAQQGELSSMLRAGY